MHLYVRLLLVQQLKTVAYSRCLLIQFDLSLLPICKHLDSVLNAIGVLLTTVLT